ncbi:MAG TPA: hybrid sensor histidine kinase/response regulator, partial [Marinobacter adhaerens]|nr:hybrid sensor histidine kinase/response regulator [Marinobacter adhaerens]
FQVWTQPAFIFLQLVPFVFIVYADASSVSDWTQFEGLNPVDSGGFSIVMFGAAAAVVFSLIAQIGEQVDFLRFIPEPRNAREKRRWWAAVMAGGGGGGGGGGLKNLAGGRLSGVAV